MSTPFLTTALAAYVASPELEEASATHGSFLNPSTTRFIQRAIKDIKRWNDLAAPIVPSAYGVAGDGVTDDVAAKKGITVSDGKREMVSGAAAPTSGYWQDGSIVWNENMAVGQPVGWFCTVTGSPGTWVAGPNL